MPTGLNGPICIFWASLTPFSLKHGYCEGRRRSLLGSRAQSEGAASGAGNTRFSYAVSVGLGRIIALYHHSSASRQIR
jgi:hypothetical protein